MNRSGSSIHAQAPLLKAAIAAGALLQGCSVSSLVAGVPAGGLPIAQLEMSPFAQPHARTPPTGLRYLTGSEIRRLFQQKPLRLVIMQNPERTFTFMTKERFRMRGKGAGGNGSYDIVEDKVCLSFDASPRPECFFLLSSKDKRHFIVEQVQPAMLAPVKLQRGGDGLVGCIR